jgi:transcriptional regulator with XRE-family HTH domain
VTRRPRPSTTTGAVAGSTTPSQRHPLGARLRALREAAGVRQTDLAARLGITQGRISRLEMETAVPTTDLIARYLDALSVSEGVRQDILDRLVEQRAEVATWRRLHRAGLREHQRRYAEQERAAKVVRNWSDRVIPGLLQTPDYIRAMCAVWDVPGLTDVEGIVDGRLERQGVLHDRSKRFAFLISEVVLRTTDVPPEVMQDQLDAILVASLMSHVELAVIPAAAMVPASTDFRILDEQAVVIDLDTREVRITEPDEIARYLDVFDRLRARALRGDALADLIRDVRRGLAGPPE